MIVMIVLDCGNVGLSHPPFVQIRTHYINPHSYFRATISAVPVSHQRSPLLDRNPLSTRTTMASTPDGKPSGILNLAFFKCDSLEKESIEKHGEYQGKDSFLSPLVNGAITDGTPSLIRSSKMTDVIHNLFEPLLPEHLKLETKSYDVLDKREYPTDDELKGEIGLRQWRSLYRPNSIFRTKLKYGCLSCRHRCNHHLRVI